MSSVPNLEAAVLERAAQSSDGAVVLDAFLARLLARLHEVLTEASWTVDAMVDVMAIYNSVAHILLFLDETGATGTLDELRQWRQRFHEDRELDSRLLRLLGQIQCDAPDAEQARREYINQLEQATSDDNSEGNRELRDRLAALQMARTALDAEKRVLLQRLGASAGARPDDVFSSTLAGTDNAATRMKLRAAWRSRTAGHQQQLVRALDEVIAARRVLAAQRGFVTVVEQLLGNRGPSEGDISRFLDLCVEHALSTHRTLAEELRGTVGVDAEVGDHIDFLIGQRSQPPLRFALGDCFDYVLMIAGAVFDLEFQQEVNDGSPYIGVDVHAQGHPVGRIYIDAWDAPHKSMTAHHTTGVRNRTEWPGRVQRPVAFVSCRFTRPGDGSNTITLQNMRSLLHEFGHALQHLLIRRRLPFQSGIEYLPPERREILPSWFESWIHHDSLADQLVTEPIQLMALTQSRWRLSIDFRRKAVERAAVAWLDFNLYRSAHGGVHAALERLDERFRISDHCEISDLLTHLSQAAYVQVPGVSFMYQWGKALGMEAFDPFCDRLLKEAASAPMPTQLTPCFDLDTPSAVPSPAALFAFHAGAQLGAVK